MFSLAVEWNLTDTADIEDYYLKKVTEPVSETQYISELLCENSYIEIIENKNISNYFIKNSFCVEVLVGIMKT